MKPITDVLREYRKGVVVDVMSEELAAVVQAVKATGKPGSITLKLEVKPEKGGGSQVELVANVSAKTPTPDLPKAIFFADAEGDLHRSDPDQREMFEAAEARASRA